MRKTIFFQYILLTIFCTSNIYSQPNKKKHKANHGQILSDKKSFLQIPELSIIKKFLKKDLSDFDLSCKTFFSEKSGQWSLLKINTATFTSFLTHLALRRRQAPLSLQEKKNIQNCLKNPATIQEFLHSIPSDLKPIINFYDSFESNENWESFLISLIKHNNTQNKTWFEFILSSMLEENAFAHLKKKNSKFNFYTHAIAKIYFPYLHQILHYNDNRLQHSDFSSENSASTVYIQALHTLIMNTNISEKNQNNRRKIQPTCLDSQIKKFFYWGQSSVSQSYANTAEILARAPQSPYIQEIAFHASEVIFNISYALESTHSDRFQLTFNQLSDHERGIRRESFSWEDLPPANEEYPGLKALNQNLLSILQNLDYKLKSLPHAELSTVKNDIINMIYQFDMDRVENTEELIHEAHTLNNYLRIIHSITIHQPAESIRQSLQHLKELMFFLSHLFEDQTSDEFLATIDQSIVELAAQYPLSVIKDILKKYDAYSQYSTQEGLNPYYMVITFLGHSPELFQTAHALERMLHTIDPDEIIACINSQEMDSSSWELPHITDNTYQKTTHHIFQMKAKVPNHIKQAINQSTHQSDEQKEDIINQYERNLFLIYHMSTFLFSDQIHTISRHYPENNMYLETEPHIPTQLKDIINALKGT